jgi:hypothetical protein
MQADDRGRIPQPIIWTLASRQLRLLPANIPTALVCLYTLIEFIPCSVIGQQQILPIRKQGIHRFHGLIHVKRLPFI